VPVEPDAANARLRGLLAELAELEAQVAGLAARVGMNSQISSKPPSSDGSAKLVPKSLRAKSGRKPGRPKGRPGVTVQLSDSPDHVVRHASACCSGCAAGPGGAAEEGVICRQVTEIPAARAEITEHQVIGRRCGYGTVTWADAPDRVTASIQYGPRGGGRLLPVAREVPVRGRACQAMADLFGCAPSAGALASMTRKIAGAVAPAPDVIRGTLGRRRGRASRRDRVRVAGRLAWVHSASSGKYVLVTMGIALNAGRRSALQKKRDALATRISAREANYLRFACDLRVPFDNNPAEQVIRMVKLRIKVSGCMRSMRGAQTFCAIRSYLATASRHGIGWLDALTQAALDPPGPDKPAQAIQSQPPGPYRGPIQLRHLKRVPT
jgi:hypothetical protein